MRILYNSKDTRFKKPFGTLTEGQRCSIEIHIPSSCRTVRVSLAFLKEDKSEYKSFAMSFSRSTDGYDIYSVDFSLPECGLFFYYFRITTVGESFSLYKEGYCMTNMEDGELWQLSVIPREFKVPKEYFGAIMYQIFPDRFNSKGKCDVSEKLRPFFVHGSKSDIPFYLPNEKGVVENSDFFGGNLRGIAEKLDYLKSLSVQVIYLNPIFKAYSNHRYDTADYMKIDEMLGTEEDFKTLCRMAHERGMKIILDGVFSHTGSNSRYFDKEGVFGGGACSDPMSPYREWYDFKSYPDSYASWWGIPTLPCVRELCESYLDFIIRGEDSVVAHWIRAGADGFRLDVADELPDEFIYALRKRLKEIKPSALLIGEVWEDASKKISYGKRRKYFTDGELDSVMNYPFRNAIIDYVVGVDRGEGIRDTVMTVAENYPAEVLHVLMNMLSTHDTERILSILSPEPPPSEKNKQAGYLMPDGARGEAYRRLRLAFFLQMTLPGMPSIYYGDEIGTEGLSDPFCRGFFDWSRVESSEHLRWFRRIARLRSQSVTLRLGDVVIENPREGVVRIERRYKGECVVAYLNTAEPFSFVREGEILFCEGASSNGEKYELARGAYALVRVCGE